MRRIGIKDLLETAAAIEKSGKEIFESLAERHRTDSRLSTILGRLATEEEAHYKKILEYEKKYFHHTTLLGDLYALGEVKQYFRDFSYTHIMKDYAAFKKRTRKMSHPFEAVRLAMTLELDSILFYEKFSEANKGVPEVNALLKELMGFEANHLDVLNRYVRETLGV
jgi:rubrerythrin